MKVLLVVLLILDALAAAVSAFAGPGSVDAISPPEASFPLALYAVRTVPIGVAVIGLAIALLVVMARRRAVPVQLAAAALVVFLIAGAVQAADAVVGFQRGDAWLGWWAAGFALVHLGTALVMTRQRMLMSQRMLMN